MGGFRLTKPMPCTSIDCKDKILISFAKSLAISIGYLKVIDESGELDDRYPFVIDNCHTIVRSHCCEIRISAA